MLDEVRTGRLSTDQAMDRLSTLPFEGLGYAQIDHHRHLRQGHPEVIFGQGKTAEQLLSLMEKTTSLHGRAMATRVESQAGEWLASQLENCRYDTTARMLIQGDAPEPGPGLVVVVCAGTTDLPVAEEAVMTLTWMGSRCERVADVGVAGLHRLLPHLGLLRDARAVVVIAGMDAALASVIGGLVACPVVAVPTSVGYGANFGGVAPLLAMLNCCAPGVTVVNIDNGFGAAYAAHKINAMVSP